LGDNSVSFRTETLSAIYTPLRINTEPIRATTVMISSITMAEVISVTSGTI
jgi:hypothetical protein